MANDLNLAIRITADGKSAVVDMEKVATAAARMKDGLEASGRIKPLNQQGIDAATQALARTSAEAARAAARSDTLGGSIQRVAHYAIGLAALGQVGQYAKQALDMAEAYGQLQARLKLVTDTSGEYAAAQESVQRISASIGAPLAETTQMYARLAPVLKEVGFEQRHVSDLTELVAKSLRLSGAGAQESASTMMQFSQAMGSGVLRGDEFNSLMENSPVLMRKLAEGMGEPIDSLRKMAEAGELTSSQVAESLLKMKGDIDREYGQLPKTVNQAWTSLSNEVMTSIGEMNQTSGTTQALANGLELVRQNLDSVGKAAAIVAGGLALAGTAAAMFTPVGLAVAGVGAAVAGLTWAFAELKGAEDERSASTRKAREEDEKSEKVFNEINASIVRLSKQKAPSAVIDGMTRLRQELNAGKIDSKAAEKALAEMVQNVNVEGGKLRAAESFFKPFLPDVAKIKKALAEVDANYKVMQKNGVANEAAYQAARNKIINDAYGDQIKLQDALRKEAIGRELTDDQQKIAALLETEKQRVTAAKGNEDLIRAARAGTTEGVKALMVAEYTVTKKSAEDRYNEIKANLDKATAEEAKYAGIVQSLQETLSGKKQSWADADRERSRVAMSDASAQADRIREIDTKLAEAETARAAGDDKSAQALADQSIQLAGNIKNTNDRADAEKRAREIIEKSYQAQIDKNTDLMRSAEQRKDALSAAEKAQKQELDNVTDRLKTLDEALKNPRALDINTGAALNKIAEVQNKIDSLSLNAVTNAMTAAGNQAAAAVRSSGSSAADSYGLSAADAYNSYAEGGRISGPGTGTSDSILAAVSNDEYIVKEVAAKRVGYGALDYINRTGELPRFAAGGRVGGASSTSSGSGSITIENLNLPGVSNARQLVAELKQMLRTEPNLLSSNLQRTG